MAQGDLVALGVASTGWERAGEQQGGVEGELQSPLAHKGQKKKKSVLQNQGTGDSQSQSLRIWEAQEAAMRRG